MDLWSCNSSDDLIYRKISLFFNLNFLSFYFCYQIITCAGEEHVSRRRIVSRNHNEDVSMRKKAEIWKAEFLCGLLTFISLSVRTALPWQLNRALPAWCDVRGTSPSDASLNLFVLISRGCY